MAESKSKVEAFFDTEKYLNTTGIARKIVTYRKGQIIFSQGARGNSVSYLRQVE